MKHPWQSRLIFRKGVQPRLCEHSGITPLRSFSSHLLVHEADRQRDATSDRGADQTVVRGTDWMNCHTMLIEKLLKKNLEQNQALLFQPDFMFAN